MEGLHLLGASNRRVRGFPLRLLCPNSAAWRSRLAGGALLVGGAAEGLAAEYRRRTSKAPDVS